MEFNAIESDVLESATKEAAFDAELIKDLQLAYSGGGSMIVTVG